MRWSNLLLMAFSALATVNLAAQSQVATPEKGVKMDKVFILGNSITRHGPKADIGWTGNWGMAASAQDKDYVHLLLQHMAAARGGKEPEAQVKNIAAFERGYATYDIQADLKPYASFSPDIVVLAIGENVPELKTQADKDNLRKALSSLLGILKQNGNPSIFVRSCFWANPAKDAILKEACAEFGGTFVDISALHKDKANFARSERSFSNDGVANHPGDKGMAAIADAIWLAISGKNAKSN